MTGSIARQTTSEHAAKITDIMGERGANYGSPEDNFARTGEFWTVWMRTRYGIEVKFDATDVAMFNSLLKAARLGQTPHHGDSALDGAVYMMLAQGCAVDARVKAQVDTI